LETILRTTWQLERVANIDACGGERRSMLLWR